MSVQAGSEAGSEAVSVVLEVLEEEFLPELLKLDKDGKLA